MNDRDAKLIGERKEYVGGGNCPTVIKEYECPCGCGKIISSHISGFNEYDVKIDCPVCAEKYTVLEGCGHLWELRERR